MTSTLIIWGIGVFIGGLLLGGFVGWLLSQVRSQHQREELKVRLVELQKSHETDTEKLAWVEQAQTQMRDAFEALASHALQSNSDELLHRSRDQIEGFLGQTRTDWQTQRAELQNLVDPLKENLTALDGHVRELEQKREGAYQTLQEQLRGLAQTHADLQTTTVTLTQALKSSSVRGRWGELQLRRVVEMAGMVKHIDFIEQASGDSGRPDMIAHLPNGGVLPVDAKVPLEAYLEAMGSCDEQTRRINLDNHAKAMQSRVRDLARKRYWEQFDKAPDFVIMFVPNDGCLGSAFESDPTLLEFALGQRVLIASPVTLLALLKTIAYGWQQQQISENARQIAAQGKELYARIGVFVGHLVEVSKNLNRTVDEYNKAVGSLEHRLVPAIRRLETLGIASSELTVPDVIELRARSPLLVGNEHESI